MCTTGRVGSLCLSMFKHKNDNSSKAVTTNWSPEEGLVLKEKVSEFGLKKWKEIATYLPGRMGN